MLLLIQVELVRITPVNDKVVLIKTTSSSSFIKTSTRIHANISKLAIMIIEHRKK